MGNKSLTERLDRIEQRSKGVSQRAYTRRLREIVAHLAKAADQPSPALALHRNGARTPLFQLECLARLHRATIDDDDFLPLHTSFKSLEDLLGAVDFADALVKRLSEANADSELRAYFVGRRAEACFQAERHLESGEWWPEKDQCPEALEDILETIEESDWPGARKEKKAFAEYFEDCASSMQEKLEAGEYDFTELEAGVHEVRRKVRWLSILPAALDGLFVRPDEAPTSDPLAKYFTPAVLASPFNSFAPKKDVPDPIVVDSPSFLALSWFIAELGGHKDRGQTADALLTAARDLEDGPKAAAARVRKVLGDAAPTHKEFAATVEPIAKAFVKDGVLTRLAKSVSKSA
jgi:hypothetical protein